LCSYNIHECDATPRDPTGGAKSAPQTWLDFGERKGRKNGGNLKGRERKGREQETERKGK